MTRFKNVEPENARRIEAEDALIAKHEAFWVERLATLKPIAIPYAESKASHSKQKRYANVLMPVPHSVITELEERHPAWNQSDFLLAAFAAYLARIGGTYCFDIGFRDVELQRELVGLEGFFASHVPCRLDVGDEQSFEQVFEAVREQVELTKLHKTYARDAFARYPALRSVPDLPRENMFPVIIERVERLDDHNARLGNELTLVIPEDGKECCWLYDAEALDGDSIARMLRQFATFLQGIVTDTAQCIAYLPLLASEERHLILVSWNDTQVDYPKDVCIHALFETQVEKTPDAPAVVFEDQQLTYRELNCRANQLAHYLRTLGVGPDVLVGLCVTRSLEMVIGVLGILKAGGAYVPIDPTYPSERKAFILKDTQTLILLTQQRLAVDLPTDEIKVICLDTDWKVIAQECAEKPVTKTTAENLAYVIYTSGSTGKPKGTMIPHQGLVNYLSWCTQAYTVEQGAGTLVHSPLGFDLTITSLFSPLLVGRQVKLLPENQGIETLSYALRQSANLSLVKITPAHLELLERQLSTFVAAGRTRAFIIGGENLLAQNIAFWQNEAPDTMLVNEYGPTETVVGCCIYQVPTGQHHSGSIPIGHPIANTQIYLLDAQMQPVPIGVTGELYIGGDGLARGYLNRPELTAQRFIPNPFSDKPGARLYKTGDLARYLPDGNIEYLGRIDHQVKIRGFRIELGEIEAVLAGHPAVRETVVIAREDVLGDKRLVAYLVPNQEELAPTISDLRCFLKEKLPDYMVPSTFVMLPALPLTPNGKVDRRALPAPDSSRKELQDKFVAPSTPTEEILAAIWAEVLGLQQVGINDNFFELGGHSLLATSVISRIREAFSIELPLGHVFEAPTIASLSKVIETARSAESQGQSSTSRTFGTLPPLVTVPRDTHIPLSFAQQHVWIAQQLNPDSCACNTSIALRFTDPLFPEVLEKSINEIIRRHEILRTTFTILSGQPVQVIAESLTLPLKIVDLQDLPPAEREASAQRLSALEAQYQFDLASGPLIKTTLLKLPPEEHRLLITMHHIITDGWSFGTFLQELRTLYSAFSNGLPSPLPEVPFQYADFTLWQRKWLNEEVLEKQFSYWQKKLADIPLSLDVLPTDRPGYSTKSRRTSFYSIVVPESLVASIEALSRSQGVTIFAIILTALNILLFKCSGQTDIIVLATTANRSTPLIEKMLGCFINEVYLRTQVDGSQTGLTLLDQVNQTVSEAINNQEIPVEKVDEISSGLKFIRTVSVSMVPSVHWYGQLLNCEVVSVPHEGDLWDEEVPLDLYVSSLGEDSKTIEIQGYYSTDLFTNETIERLFSYYQEILQKLVGNPKTKLSEL